MEGLGDMTGRLFARLVETLQAEFAATGACVAQTAELDDCTEWRRAARVAGHRMGVFVATGYFGPADELVWAKTYDHPVTDADRREARALVESAILATASTDGLLGRTE
ncbi:MAG: hypothetical protein ACLPR9_01535 [Acidimicrobiales bacterium]